MSNDNDGAQESSPIDERTETTLNEEIASSIRCLADEVERAGRQLATDVIDIDVHDGEATIVATYELAESYDLEADPENLTDPEVVTDGDGRSLTQCIYDSIEALGGDRGEAPVGNVINRVATNHDRPLQDVMDEVGRLLVNGELYQPHPATIRRTDPPVATDGGTGAIDNSFADAEQTIHVGDHVTDLEEDDDRTMVVVGFPNKTAEEYIVSSGGMEPAETVADYNPEYPETDDVVEVVYPQRTDTSLPTDKPYAFPRSRLEVTEHVHDIDGEGGEN